MLQPPAAAAPSGPRAAQWRAVEEAARQGQPATALERLRPILDATLREQAWPEAVRAVGTRIALETSIQGERPEERVRRLVAEATSAAPPLRPYLHQLVARGYWTYFQQNRWRFQERTAVAPAPADAADAGDFQTWDLRRLFAEIDRHFDLALAEPALLQAAPIATQDALLDRGTVPDKYRPTLFDFLAHDALEFYAAGEQAGARPEDAFVVDASSPILSDVAEFLAWQPVTTDTNSVVLSAIRLHQAVLRFHEKDADPAAFWDADLARLVYARNVASGPDRDARFLAAIEGLARRAASDEVSARIRHEWAMALQRLFRLVEARAVAAEADRAHPRSVGAAACRNLVRAIDQPTLRLSAERVWTLPHPALSVAYRNLTRVHFKAVRVDWAQFLQRRQPRPDNLRREQRLEFMRQASAAEWSADLPPATDHLEHTVDAAPPDSVKLEPGFYFLFASVQPGFSADDNTLAMADVWVSDLALILRPRAGRLEGFVLDANSGEPLPRATVEAWDLRPNGERVSLGKPLTDELGFFAFPENTSRGQAVVRATLGNRQVAVGQDVWWGPVTPEPDRRVSRLFTDRALYRPGQLVHYKGICLGYDTSNDRYRVLPGENVVVVFKDANHKEIARQTRRANDYGSFSGSFTAPTDRLPGAMSISVEEPLAGAVAVHVEEYKRPKFQVLLDAPRTAPRLNDTVVVTGRATAYTGAAIDAGEVRWRVTRQVRFPPWWGWFRNFDSGPDGDEEQEIAHGTSRTDAGGTFEIAFQALPDRGVPETDEPVFHFEVHADVTDGAGETRSDERDVRVGYTALQATLAASEWQERERPVELRLETRSLDGEGQPAEGTLAIHRVREPERVPRPPLDEAYPFLPRSHRAGVRPADPSDPNHWPLGELVQRLTFRTGASGVLTNAVSLAPGLYRVLLETRDRFGKPVTARLPLHVLDPAATRLAAKLPHLLVAPAWSVEPGADFKALWGTGYESGRAFVEIEDRDRIVERYWTPAGRTQVVLRHAVTEALRGGFTLHVTRVRDNRADLESRSVEVPWSNKELELSWETFRSKLEPGAKETWTAVIRRRTGVAGTARPLESAVAELVATLYDASLDQFAPHEWPERFSVFPRRRSSARPQFANALDPFQTFLQSSQRPGERAEVSYRRWPDSLRSETYGFLARRAMPAMALSMAAAPPPASEMMMFDAEPTMAKAAGGVAEEAFAIPGAGGGTATDRPPAPAPAAVAPRRNLSETAFFLPHVLSDSNGVVRLSFTLPEALTEWRFLGFAHDRELRSGSLGGSTVTARDLMVQPNPPRFLREADQLEFTVKVSNQSDARQSGRARLSFQFAQDGTPADAALGNAEPERPFEIPARESRTLAWRISVPDGCGFLAFKATAATDRLADGEEGFLPVLPRRVHLTESLPLPIRGPAEKRFRFARLEEGSRSPTLRHEGLTVQMVSNPAWYAVLALPYLMEFPHQCAEQTFNRYYANALARHLAVRDPRIRSVFDQWRATPALDSPLARNQDLKSLLIEETPWLRESDREGEARRQIAVFFEANRLDAELERALRQLAELQLPDGGWPWFPGGPRNEFVTLYLATGFGRLRHLGVEVPLDQAQRALQGLDAWITERHRRIPAKDRDASHLDATVALYLYGRSFFLRDQPIAEPHRAAVEYYLAQATRHWLPLDRQSQGHLALALHRFGPDRNELRDAARLIVRSLFERSVVSEELGRHWRDTELSWWWYRAPIETQALMIEVFDEVARDPSVVEDLQVWLLKQKQTRDWKTTKATADAVYALLGRGTDLLASTRLVEVEIGGRKITPSSRVDAAPRPPERRESRTPLPAVEPGTGFYEIRIPAAEVSANLADILVRKSDPGVAWGGVHWQYFEDLSAVKPYEGTPLTLRKALFLRERGKAGAVLQPLRGPARVGDELVVRLELRVDRDLEFVHLKDQRGSGTEPVEVLSGYRFQDGLAYYETTRDTASHFFIDYLPKGTYVFEYPVRIQHRGTYAAGVATIQCLYAPEFNGHSQGFSLRVE